MKKLLLIASAFVLGTSAFAQAKADEIAKIKLETIELGKIKQNEPATAVFVVTNIGTKDLLIETASPTCGCTIGDYTKTPIKPGQTGEITATYNAASLGAFDKHMNVKFAGADDMKSITLRGEVLAAEEYAKLKGGSATPQAAVSVSSSKEKTVVKSKTASPRKVKEVKKAK